MKKLTSVLVIALVCVSVFAGQKAELSVKPYSLGHFEVEEGFPSETSKYGFGGAISMVYPFNDSILSLGGEIDGECFMFNDETSCFDFSFLVKGGADAKIEEKDNAFFYVKTGVMFQFYGINVDLKPVLGAQAGISRLIAEHTSLVLSVEGLTNFPGFKINTVVGVKYEI